MKRTTLAIAIAAALLTAACLQKDTTSTIYLRPDGSFDWVVLEQHVRSDESDAATRHAEEAGYVDAVSRGDRHGRRACSPSAAQDVRMRCCASTRPYAVMVDARFDSLAGVFDRGSPCGVPTRSGHHRADDVTTWRCGRRRRRRRAPRRGRRRRAAATASTACPTRWTSPSSSSRERSPPRRASRSTAPTRRRSTRRRIDEGARREPVEVAEHDRSADAWRDQPAKRREREPAARHLDVVPQHQLLRVRIEVDLAGQVLDLVAPHVMPDQRERHDERHEALAVVLDAGEQFLLLVGVEQVLEVARPCACSTLVCLRVVAIFARASMNSSR